jgi:hypothetical protein
MDQHRFCQSENRIMHTRVEVTSVLSGSLSNVWEELKPASRNNLLKSRNGKCTSTRLLCTGR